MQRVGTIERVLPDLDTLDTDRLKAVIVEQHFELISHKNEIDNLKLLVHKLRRMQFGRSSEKLQRQIEQLELRLEDLEANRVSKPIVVSVEEPGAAVKPHGGPCRRSCRGRPS
jgi:hypothetical protein